MSQREKLEREGSEDAAALVKDLGGPATVLEINPNPMEVAILERGLFAYEEARLGSPLHEHFSIFLRNEKGHIQGGVDAHVMWRRLFVKTLWVEEALRRKGYGQRLMNDLEREAQRRGCLSIWLTALGPPACQFYLKQGFAIVGAIKDYVANNTLYTMEKACLKTNEEERSRTPNLSS